MTTTDQVKFALENYFHAVDSQKTSHPLDLATPIQQLDALSNSPDPGWPAPLRHYMESRSYRKAYAVLGGAR